jgi:hypothetical protein
MYTVCHNSEAASECRKAKISYLQEKIPSFEEMHMKRTETFAMVFFGVSHLELNLDVDYSTRRLFVVHF